jgi:hypothetical protein
VEQRARKAVAAILGAEVTDVEIQEPHLLLRCVIEKLLEPWVEPRMVRRAQADPPLADHSIQSGIQGQQISRTRDGWLRRVLWVVRHCSETPFKRN